MRKRTIFYGVVVLLVVLTGAITFNTLKARGRQEQAISPAVPVVIDADRAAQRLSTALRYKTISRREPSSIDSAEFLKLHDHLKASYPLVHQRLKVEKVNTCSLLYTWEGSEPSLKPVILAAHMDVVDVDPGTLTEWTYPPFSGEIADGIIWGRGARDNKSQMLAILEAVEYLLQQRFQPNRTVILAFGHDEEVLGVNGASNIVELLAQRQVAPECVVDEGGTVRQNAIPGLKGEAALIGIGEKGYLTLELTASGRPGHSSSPEEETSIGILSRAVVKLEKNQFPATLTEVKPMFTYAAGQMRFPFNVVFSNLWITGPVVEQILLNDSETAAMLRTTMAPTVINGGFQDNVIPASARVVVNLRLMPQDDIESVVERIRQTINDSRISIKPVGYSNNAPISSSTETKGFKIVSKAIKQVFPTAICVPFFDTGGTDSKHYARLTPNLYRFTPSIKARDEEGHGINERIPVENYLQYINFYINLIKDFQVDDPATF
ncbi:MAG: M20 family peptidase [Syntrophomonas sp.]